jgi:uncharacterized protein involved in exopolysaccharide biosynthesis
MPEPTLPNLSPYKHDDMMEDEISLLDLAITLAKHKKLIIGLPFIVAMLAAVGTLIIPNTYTATTRVLPSVAAIPKETLVSLLNSQLMSDSLIHRFRLQPVYQTRSHLSTRKALQDAVKIVIAKDGVIDISVDDKSPQRAALMANSFPVILQQITHNFGLTEAAQRRRLLERQLPDAKHVFDQAELDLNSVRRGGGIDKSDERVQELVRKSSELKAKIAMKEVELVTMGVFDPARNPNYIRTQQELSDLWSEFSKVDNSTMTTGKVSDAELDYLRKIRDLNYNETRYDQLLKQIEIAKADEIKETPSIQVLERADIPEQHSKPKRAMIVMTSALAAGFLAILWAFIAEALQKTKADEKRKAGVHLLLTYLHWK